MSTHEHLTYWLVSYYGTGMSRQEQSYSDCAEAWAHWDRIKDDPMAGADCIERVTILATKELH